MFLGGLTLMRSGLVPEAQSRIEFLRDIVPLPFAEASNMSASLSGLALIVLSRGLALRMAPARVAATVILIAGAVFALVKGLDIEAAAIMLALALALTAARHRFYRSGDWRQFRPGRLWFAMVALSFLAVLAIGMMWHANTAWRSELWWKFAWDGDAPRFLRAALALAVALAVLGFDSLINRATPVSQRPMPLPPEARALIAAAPESARQVALLGDKAHLLSPGKDACLFYGTIGRSWVCLHGPLGAPEAAEKLVWAFAARAHRAGARPVFYNVPQERITTLLNLGHAIVKTGEEARVSLADFTLEGPARKDLRYARSRAARDGLAFRIIPAAEVPALIPALREVSDAWLARQGGREKGFSLGRFDPAYLANFDCALFEREGRIVAFANLWRGADRHEVAIDLMRHLPGQSPVLMEALMVECMLAAQAEGYRWFGLGGAPFSGLPEHPLAPISARIGTLLYRYGDEFYSFDGLRRFKEKFAPDWRPVFMTCPSGRSIPRTLIDIGLLISRPALPGEEADDDFSD